MTFNELITVVDKCSTFVLAALALFINYRLGKMHKQFNSRMDQTIELVKEKAKREGKEEEKAETQAKTT